jgi:hypothetical protein
VHYLFCILLLISTTSCASASKNIQPQINSLVSANRLDRALTLLGDDPSVYGAHNHLLFWLDKGMTAQLAGRLHDSIGAFEEAEKLNEILYTKSLTQMANTWIINNSKEDYRADEQEYVMLNVFQAFNFATQGNIDEALVEARRMDEKLKNIGPRYKNPFAYFLSGLLWHTSNEQSAFDDALIDYQKAMDTYEKPPQTLKDLMAEAQKENKDLNKARIFVIEYTGFIPIKVANSYAIPMGYSNITKFSFPRYQDRYSDVNSSRVKVVSGGVAQVKETEIVCDLGKLAKEILEGKKASIYAKAGIRPLLKYGATKALEIPAQREGGDIAASLVGIAGSIYSLATEEADLRSWQSLPNHIRMTYFDVNPGTYEIVVEDLAEDNVVASRNAIQIVNVKAGDKKFITSRSWL